MEILFLILLATFVIVGVLLLTDRGPRRRIHRVVEERPVADRREPVIEDEVVERRRVTRG